MYPCGMVPQTGLRVLMAKDSLSWLARLCELYAKHATAVQQCTIEPHSSGAVVSLIVKGGTVRLLLKPKGEGKRYAETTSLAVSLMTRPNDCTLKPREAEQFALDFIEVLRRADKGHIDLMPPKPAEHSAKVPIDIIQLDPMAVQAAEALEDEIHWASFVGYKALITEDLYPHVGPLGEILSEKEI